MDVKQHQAFSTSIGLILGGASEPDWLDYRLKRSVETICRWREAEAKAPTRKETRRRLNEFSGAVEVLKEGVSDPAFSAFLGYDWLPANMLYIDVVKCLDELSHRANKAALRLAGQGGRAEAYPTEPDEALSAMELCAWTVMHAMMFARDVDAVGPDNSDALDAANHLWQAAGGTPLGRQDGSPPTGWRDYFLAVKVAEQGDERCAKGLRDLLTQFRSKVLVEIG